MSQNPESPRLLPATRPMLLRLPLLAASLLICIIPLAGADAPSVAFRFTDLVAAPAMWAAGYQGVFQAANLWKEPFTVSQDKDDSGSGTGSLRVDIGNATAGIILLNTPRIPVRQPPGYQPATRISIRIFLKMTGFQPGDITIYVYETDKDGQPVAPFEGKEPLATVPNKEGWVEVDEEGGLFPRTEAFNLDFHIRSTKGPATLLISGIEISVDPESALVFTSDAKGNVFTSDKGEVTLHVQSPEKISDGKVTVRDEAGNLLDTIPVPPSKETVAVPLSRGFSQISATVRHKDGTSQSAETTAAVVGPKLDEAVRMKSRMGLWSVEGDRDLTEAAGAHWNRRIFSLVDYNPEFLRFAKPGSEAAPSHPAVTTSDPVFDYDGAFGGRGLPPWMMDIPKDLVKGEAEDHPMYPPKNWDELRDLVKAFGKHPPVGAGGWALPFDYQTSLKNFEVFNEPEWVWKGTPEELVTFHKVVAEGLREVFPNVKILGPCFSNVRIDPQPGIITLPEIFKLGLLDYVDGIVVHAYADDSPPEGDFIKRIIELKDLLVKEGKPGLPIHITEFGWTTGPNHFIRPVDSELTQARYLARSFILLIALGIKNATWFCQYWEFYEPGNQQCSITHLDNTPRPAYAAFANTARWLADVRGEGRWFQLSPSVNLVLFQTDRGPVGAAWRTEGSEMLELPGIGHRIDDMMGRPIVLQDDGALPLSPSPVYFESPAGAYSAKVVDPLKVMRGHQADLPSGKGMEWVVPSPLKVVKDRVEVSDDAPYGKYLLLGVSRDGWIEQPVEVAAPLIMTPPQMIWPSNEENPLLITKVTACFPDKSRDTHAWVKLDKSRSLFSDPIKLPNGDAGQLRVALRGLAEGRRYRGQMDVENRGAGGRDFVTSPLDFTILSSHRYTDSGSVDWSKVPEIDSGAWTPYPGMLPERESAPTLQTVYNRQGVLFRIRVWNDKFQQDQAGENLWKGDSVQFAFDPDADRPWVTNDLFTFRGHRFVEYTVALSAGRLAAWRGPSLVKGIPSNSGDTGIVGGVKREGDITTYEVMFPWTILGLKEMPAPGSSIGLAVLINDWGVGEDRHGLKLYDGIINGKDPGLYGKLWLH